MENSTPDTNTGGTAIPQITVQDLAGIKSIIEAACQRGAFRAEEMKPIGELYDRLAGFLSAVQPQVTPPDQEGIAPITEPSTGE